MKATSQQPKKKNVKYNQSVTNVPIDKLVETRRLVETRSGFKNLCKIKSESKNKTKQSNHPPTVPTVPKQSKANAEEMPSPGRQLRIEIIVNKCSVPELFLSANETSPGQFTRIPLDVEQNCRKDERVSYHGTAFDSVKEIILNGYDKDANPSRLYKPKKGRYGKGIYTSPNVMFCKNILYAQTFEYKGRHYQLVLKTKSPWQRQLYMRKIFSKRQTKITSRSRQY